MDDSDGIMISSALTEALAHDWRRDDLMDIIRERSIRTGEFTLASGQKSSLYINLKPTLLDAYGSRLCGDLMAQLLEETIDARGIGHNSDRIFISGMAVGAVPLIATMAASDLLEIQGTFVRKAAKDHGTREVIEGLTADESLSGREVFVVEDVCTTGKSILEAVAVLRAEGAVIEDALTIVERGGRDALSQAGIKLHSLFQADEFILGG